MKPHSSEMCIFLWLCGGKKSFCGKFLRKHTNTFTTSAACTAIKKRFFLFFSLLPHLLMWVCESALCESALFVFFHSSWIENFYSLWKKKHYQEADSCSFIADVKTRQVVMMIVLQNCIKVATTNRMSIWSSSCIFSVCLNHHIHHFWSCIVTAFANEAEGWANHK